MRLKSLPIIFSVFICPGGSYDQDINPVPQKFVKTGESIPFSGINIKGQINDNTIALLAAYAQNGGLTLKFK